MKRIAALAVALLLLSTLPAIADNLSFTGSVPSTPGFVGLVTSTGTFVLIAPLTSLSAGGSTYSDSAVLVLEVSPPTGTPNPTTFTYGTGGLALYATSDWNFSTLTGTNPIFLGTIGDSSVTFFAPVGGTGTPQYATEFFGQVTSGTFLGSFGGYDLTHTSFNNGGLQSLSLDFQADENGVLSIPVATEFDVKTPEPATLILLATGLIPLLRRRRQVR